MHIVINLRLRMIFVRFVLAFQLFTQGIRSISFAIIFVFNIMSVGKWAMRREEVCTKRTSHKMNTEWIKKQTETFE